MKRKTVKILLTACLAITVSAAAAACGTAESAENVGDLPTDQTQSIKSGRMLTLSSGEPDAMLGEEGDICLVAETGILYRKSAKGWAATEFTSYNASGSTLTVTYTDGSMGTYDLAPMSGDCAHETFEDPYIVYPAKCVIPGIAVKTCTECHESFPVVLPATGEHEYAEGSYDCLYCGTANYFKDATLHEAEEWAPEGYYVIHDVPAEAVQDGTIEVPGEIKDLPVVIGEGAFSGNKELIDVELDEGIVGIEANAFNQCSYVQTLHLPDTLRFIGDGAFYKCSKIENLRLPDALKYIGKSAFESLYVTELTIPASVGTIDYRAFNNCTKLQHLTLSEGLHELGESAFTNCSSLEEINIPNSVVTIGKDAFYLCGKVQTISIGSGLQTAEEDAFKLSSQKDVLTKIEVADDNPYFEDTNNCLIDSVNHVLLLGCNDSVIPDGIAKIGDEAFYYRKSISSVRIPASVIEIGNSAFCNCSSLTEVMFEESDAMAMEDYGFSHRIQTNAFANTAIQKVNIPAHFEEIGSYAFSGSSSNPEAALSSLTFSSGSRLKVIGKYAFRSQPIEGELIIPASVTEIGDSAFFSGNAGRQSKSKIQTLIFEEGAETDSLTIGANAFQNCSYLESVVFSKNLKSIDKEAFSGCIKLEKINFPDGCMLESLGSSAFYSTSLVYPVDEPLVLPTGLKTLGGKAFATVTYGTTKTDMAIEKIVLPEGLESIGSNCFEESQLKDIIIPASVHTLEAQAFYGARNLENLVFADGGPAITEIPRSCFYNCRNLTSIEIPEGVTTIGYQSFYGCGFTSIKLPEALTTFVPAKTGETTASNVGTSYTFGSCTKLTSITIPNSVQGKLGGFMFASCTNLETIVIGDGVTELGEYFFQSCTSLKNVTLGKNVRTIGQGAFTNKDSYYKPCTALQNITISASVETIGANAFTNCTALESISCEKGSQLQAISSNMFSGCKVLGEITIPASVKNIATGAFVGCNALKYARFEENSTLESIESNAFNTGGTLYDFRIPASCKRLGTFGVNENIFRNTRIDGGKLIFENTQGWTVAKYDKSGNITEGPIDLDPAELADPARAARCVGYWGLDMRHYPNEVSYSSYVFVRK